MKLLKEGIVGSQVVYFTCQTKPELVCLEIHRQTLGAVIMSLRLAARQIWVQIPAFYSDPGVLLIISVAFSLYVKWENNSYTGELL